MGFSSEPNGHSPATSGSTANGQWEYTNGNGHASATAAINGQGRRAPEPLVEPIALCGMGLRLPGAVNDAQAFWDLLLQNKRNGRCKVPKTRYDVDNWYGPENPATSAPSLATSSTMSTSPTWIRLFGRRQKRVRFLGPSATTPARGRVRGVADSRAKVDRPTWPQGRHLCRQFRGDWLELDQRDVENFNGHRQSGSGDYMAANRIHYEFGFMGPSAVILSACSSSMIALHDACTAINAGECEAAIVGCCNLILSPRMTATMQELGVSSPSGYCHTFDAAADGYARGEAVSAVYLKKLSDAIHDGDPVRSVVRSTCLNAGGRSSTLSAPVAAAHKSQIRRCHELAGISDFSRTAMMECHGTGTPVGDPIEVQAVANVFGEHGIYVGSVKTNLGHGEGASGLSSLVKMTLALEKKTIPANLNFNTPNPNIPFESCKLKVPTETTPWPKDRDFVVGINSFGVGGSNAHALLGSAASFGTGLAEESAFEKTTIDFGLRSTLPIASPNNRVVFRKDPRLLASADPADEELTRFLQGAAVNTAVLRSEEATALLARNVGRTLFGFMLRPEDVHAPTADVGIDSLLGRLVTDEDDPQQVEYLTFLGSNIGPAQPHFNY
ncbi:hypothetical protein M406DRAFT_333211 [Cryphonectria parasitica EP155]|uniref:Ketosynthase family 3 (KS3) domain-containing protein n=1 Tax=Cryphonectria parasitica (strain ATCC 38755 / EP155) TaxID=660469 RepID=A0A9P4XXZ2_CRYP1|nr:uncharacterized protein M406DRAFT_333211 [Cryphonectria parasitica EP155]KAF3762976.1 hypothetical protein M406DRAFT_333211 [Cryphonectria parasitica EP155]